MRKVNADDKRQAAELIELDGEAANPASGAADDMILQPRRANTS